MRRLTLVLFLVLCASLATRATRAAEVDELSDLLEFLPISLHISKSLVPEVDAVVKSIGEIREAIKAQLGLTIPGVRLLEDSKFQPGEYTVCVREVEVFRGQFGDLATWKRNFTVLLSRHAVELLTRQDVYDILAERKSGLSPGPVHAVLRNLLEEQVSIADLDTILGVVAAGPDAHPDALSERARRKLNVSAPYVVEGALSATTVDAELEKRIEQASVRPDAIQGVVPDAVVLSSDSTRLALHRLLPGVTVLARSEVPEGVQLKSVGTLRLKN